MDIASYAFRFTANADGLVNVLRNASNNVASTTRAMTTSVRTMANGMNTALSSILRFNVSQQFQPLMNVASSLAGIGTAAATGGPIGIAAAVGAASVSLIAYASANMDAVATQVRLGRATGLTAQEIAGFQVVAARAGVDSERFPIVLSKWVERLAQLRQQLEGGGPMVNALARMNINAREFAQQSLPQQFAAISAAASRIENPLSRTVAMSELLGNELQNVGGNLFRQSAADLANLNDVAARTGFSISQSEAVAIESTTRQLQELKTFTGAVIANIGQGAAAAFAPVASATAELMRRGVTEMQPFLRLVGAVIVGGLAIPSTAIMIGNAINRGLMPALREVSRGAEKIWDSAKRSFAALQPIFTAGGQIFRAIFGDMQNPVESLADVIRDLAERGAERMRSFARGTAIAMALVADSMASTAEGISVLANLADRPGMMSPLARQIGPDPRDVSNRAAEAARALRAMHQASVSAAMELSMPAVNSPARPGQATPQVPSLPVPPSTQVFSMYARELVQVAESAGASRQEIEGLAAQLRRIDRAGGSFEDLVRQAREGTLTVQKLRDSVAAMHQVTLPVPPPVAPLNATARGMLEIERQAGATAERLREMEESFRRLHAAGQGNFLSPPTNEWQGFAGSILDASRNLGLFPAQIQQMRDAIQRVSELPGMGFLSIAGPAPGANLPVPDEGFSQVAESIERSNRFLGLTADEAERLRAIEASIRDGVVTWNDAMERRLRNAQIMREVGRDFEAMQQRAAQLFQSTRSPLENLRERVDELNRLREMGQIQGNTYARGLAQELQRFQLPESRGPAAAVLAGTVEERQAIVRAQQQDRDMNRDPIERIRLAIERQAEVERMQRDLLQRITDAVENGQLLEVLN